LIMTMSTPSDSNQHPTLSIIIPVYNEERTIAAVVEKVKEVDLGDLNREIVIVDDCSTDGSRAEIERIVAASKEPIKTHFTFLNCGKGAAIRAGLKCSTGDLIIFQDADLELDPSEHTKLLAPILDGSADVVYGSRFRNRENNRGFPKSTRFANWALAVLTNLLYKTRITDMETCYKAFRREVIDGVRLRALEFEIEPELTARISQRGYKIHEVPISYKPRTQAEGKKMRYIEGVQAIYMLIYCKFR
jgi:glycosyltransferase involved in cell wall biosynthesis